MENSLTRQFRIPKNLRPKIEEAIAIVEKELGTMKHEILDIPNRPDEYLVKYWPTGEQTKRFSAIKTEFGIGPESMGYTN
jgi:hypothetical protein